VLIYPDGKQVMYAYDAANRLTTVTDWAARVTSYAYDAAGLLTGTTNANGTTVSYGYDNAQRLLTMANKKADASVVSSYSFTLDGVGNRVGLNQVEPLTPSQANTSTTYTYNAANHIQSASPTTFTSDSNGNMRTKVSGTVTTNYTYDPLDRLISVSDGTTSAQYVYNGVSIRISRSLNGTVSRQVTDPTSRLPRVLAETDSSGTINSYFVHGLGLISKVTSLGTYFQYHFDARGSTIALTEASQTLVNRYSYDAFGSLVSTQEQEPNPFKYTGQFGVYSEPLGLFFASRRFYDASLGRFLTKDPADPRYGDSQVLNQFVYALNNPILFIDPSGLSGERDGSARFEAQGPSDLMHRQMIMNGTPRVLGAVTYSSNTPQFPNTTIAPPSPQSDWEWFESNGFRYRARKKKEFKDLNAWEKGLLFFKIFLKIPGEPGPGTFLKTLEPNDPRYEVDPNSITPVPLDPNGRPVKGIPA